MPIRHIFLDDGDVMNDNSLRGEQWRLGIGDFFAPRLGGTREAWALANLETVEGVDDRYWDNIRAGGKIEPENWYTGWLISMVRHVGVEAPAGDACRTLAREASMHIARGVRSAFPGAIEAIRELGQRYELYTASNEFSEILRAYLDGMGLMPLFRGFAGSDIVSAVKPDVAFYERLFEMSGVDPERSLVVDDKPAFLAVAASLGARVVLVRADGAASGGIPVVSSLAELPALLRTESFVG